MKQLLLENCILLNDKLFDDEGEAYTVKNFLELLKDQGTMKIIKNKMIKDYGKRFRDKDEVLNFMATIARR